MKEQPTKKQIANFLSALGRKGAKASNAKRTPAERSEMARAAAKARWAKAKKSK